MLLAGQQLGWPRSLLGWLLLELATGISNPWHDSSQMLHRQFLQAYDPTIGYRHIPHFSKTHYSAWQAINTRAASEAQTSSECARACYKGPRAYSCDAAECVSSEPRCKAFQSLDHAPRCTLMPQRLRYDPDWGAHPLSSVPLRCVHRLL